MSRVQVSPGLIIFVALDLVSLKLMMGSNHLHWVLIESVSQLCLYDL